MKFRIIISILILAVFDFSVSAQESEVLSKLKKINLLKSTRDDIIRVFGEPEISTYPYFKSYSLKDGKVDIEYSTGLCGNKNKDGWNVPEFTVTRIFFDFKKPPNPKKYLNIHSKDFRKYPIKDVPGAFIYENEKIGIDYSITRKGKIESVTFYPAQKYDHLYCETNKK